MLGRTRSAFHLGLTIPYHGGKTLLSPLFNVGWTIRLFGVTAENRCWQPSVRNQNCALKFLPVVLFLGFLSFLCRQTCTSVLRNTHGRTSAGVFVALFLHVSLQCSTHISCIGAWTLSNVVNRQAQGLRRWLLISPDHCLPFLSFFFFPVSWIPLFQFFFIYIVFRRESKSSPYYSNPG